MMPLQVGESSLILTHMPWLPPYQATLTLPTSSLSTVPPHIRTITSCEILSASVRTRLRNRKMDKLP